MFTNVYRLTRVKQIERVTKTITFQETRKVLVRPLYLSVCRADERYYSGTRDSKILARKLPMALIHEAVGIVEYSNESTYEVGSLVAMIPNHSFEHDTLVTDNYLATSKFSSSSEDGFLQELISIDYERLVKIPNEVPASLSALIEVASIAVQGLKQLQRVMIPRIRRLGIWGDGNVAYITAVIASNLYPECEIYVFGKHPEKLSYFSFAHTVDINEIAKGMWVDQVVEAVGGNGSESAVEQAINVINPGGTIVLSGVSEYPIEINTRKILEKGLTLIGTSRSIKSNFEQAIEIMKADPIARKRMQLLIQSIRDIHSEKDIIDSFEFDLSLTWGKTIMHWNL